MFVIYKFYKKSCVMPIRKILSSQKVNVNVKAHIFIFVLKGTITCIQRMDCHFIQQIHEVYWQSCQRICYDDNCQLCGSACRRRLPAEETSRCGQSAGFKKRNRGFQVLNEKEIMAKQAEHWRFCCLRGEVINIRFVSKNSFYYAVVAFIYRFELTSSSCLIFCVRF